MITSEMKRIPTDGCVIMINTENFWGLNKEWGRKKFLPYFAIVEHMWQFNTAPETDEKCAELARIPLEEWMSIKPIVWPKILDHTREWFLTDPSTSDKIMDWQAADSSYGEVN